MFIDAWTLNKTWSEEKLKNEILILFKEHLKTVNDFEFVKAVGNTITKVKLPEGNEVNGKTIKHIAGNGPIYIRACANIDDFNQNEIEDDLSEGEDFAVGETKTGEDIRQYAFISDQPSTSSIVSMTIDDEDKGCSSSTCQLFDFEIERLKEMFPMSSDEVLNAAIEKSANLGEAVDYVVQQTGVSEIAGDDNKESELSPESSLNELIRGVIPKSTGPPRRFVVNRNTILPDSIAVLSREILISVSLLW
ncbi:uncharacterized protein LOC114540164 [Dendronephthya gigantea]|uniref:uncharacterized protein LOC114540164 n=1 Tax=Dendronephthya gigantea TaxID=151771 RepID=UPI00106B1A79|nr:uncharacterized protein LOC114540164 [Dendronephthya gigantea]